MPVSTALPIRPRDRVTVDNGSTAYTVQAVSRAGHDAYITDGANTSIGTWVALGQLERVDDQAVTR